MSRFLSNEPVYPGNGYPPNRGEDRLGLSPFGRLAKGGALGKSSILIYDSTQDRPQASEVDMVTVEGDDLDATQLLVTLTAPRVVPREFATLPLAHQNLSGEQTNSQITSGNFPGTAAPIAWPPLEALVEWGVRGAQAQAVVDYINGVTFAVTASYLRVRAVISQVTPEEAPPLGTSAAYYLSAFVGPGFARGNAQRTVLTEEVAGEAASVVYDIPRFARRVYVFGRDAGATPVTTSAILRFWQSPDGTNNVGNVVISGAQPTPFEIPNSAQYFSLINLDESTALSFAVVFDLSLS